MAILGQPAVQRLYFAACSHVRFLTCIQFDEYTVSIHFQGTITIWIRFEWNNTRLLRSAFPSGEAEV